MSKMKYYYKSKNRNLRSNSRAITPIKKGEIEIIRVWDKGIWSKAQVEDIAQTPQFYIIKEENGSTYRPNQYHLLKSRDPEPLQIQCDTETLLGNTDLENNTELPENCPTTITTSNTSEEPPTTPQPPFLHRSYKIRKRPPYLDDYQQQSFAIW